MSHRKLAVIAAVVASGCGNDLVEIAGPVELQPSESLTFKSRQPLEASAPFAEACLLRAADRQLTQDPPYAMLAEDGKPFVPSVTMIGANGKADPFTNTSLLRTHTDRVWLCFSAAGQRPNAPYVAITVQTPVRLRLAAVRWQNYEK